MRLGLGLGVTQFRPAPSGGGGTLDAWDDPEAHPDAFLSFGADYADLAALVADQEPLFDEYFDASGCVVDDSILYHGHKSLRIDMIGFSQGWFEADLIANPHPSTEIICRRIVRFDDVTGDDPVDLGQVGNYGSQNAGGILYDVVNGRYQNLPLADLVEGVDIYTAPNPAGSFFSIVQRGRISGSGAPVNSATWIAGVKRMDRSREVNAGSASFDGGLGQYFGGGGFMTGTGACMRVVRWEYIDGAAHPDPYGLPGW